MSTAKYGLLKHPETGEVFYPYTDANLVYGLDNKINTKIQKIVGAAPVALDTLEEIAAALNNDANMYTTLSNLINQKADLTALNGYLPLTGGTMSGDINLDTNTRSLVLSTASSWTNSDRTIPFSSNDEPSKLTYYKSDFTYNPNTGALKAGSFVTKNGTSNQFVKGDGSLDSTSYATVASLAAVATSGSYNDLSNKPTIPTVPTNVSAFTNDAGYTTFDGDYNSLTNKPTIPAAQVQSDWNATSGMGEILNKPSLATVATSGNYNDLINKPTIPTVPTNLVTSATAISTIASGMTTTNADTTGVTVSQSGQSPLQFFAGDNVTLKQVKNASNAIVGMEINAVASTQPTIGTLNTNNATAQTISSSESFSGSINLHKVAKTGNYNDLLNPPSIPTKVSDLTNDSGFITSETPISISTTGGGNAITAITASDHALTLTKGSTFLTSYTETDPVFTASAASGITSADITNWNNKTSNVGTITSVTGNNGLTGSGTSGSVTISHAAPSTSPAKTTSAVYPITIDQYGHITTAGNAVTIPSEVTESTVSGWGFTKNTGTITGISTSNGTASSTSGTITFVESISGSANSGSAAISTTRKKITISDSKVTQSPSTTSGNYPILLKAVTTSGEETTTVIHGMSITANPNTNKITAQGFINSSANNAKSILLGNGSATTPSTSNTYLKYNGSGLEWAAVSGGSSVSNATIDTAGVAQMLDDNAAENLNLTVPNELTATDNGTSYIVRISKFDPDNTKINDSASIADLGGDGDAVAYVTIPNSGSTPTLNTQTLVFYGVNGTQISKTFYVQ